MKKTFLALLMTAIMLFSLPVSATTLSDFFASYSVPTSANVEVKADVQVKKTASETFVDGPINVTKKNSSAEWPVFDFRATVYMESVRNAFKQASSFAKFLIADDTALLSDFKNMPVYGRFVVSAKYPVSLSVPKSFLSASDMEGFNEEAKAVFKEISRTEKTQGKWKNLEIIVSVKNPFGAGDYVKQKDLEDNLETYLPDLTLTCPNVSTSGFGTFPVYGALEGYTNIGGNSAADGRVTSINYIAVQADGDPDTKNKLSATVSVVNGSTGSSGFGGGVVTPTPDDEVIISFNVSGDTTLVAPIIGDKKSSVNLNTIPVPQRAGYRFDGWYADASCKTPIGGLITVTKDTIIYAKWINTKAPDVLISDSHFAYINGYEDGTVRPENLVTREEVAAILYRLLKDEYKATLRADKNTFSDVLPERWSADAIFCMANGGYLKGYSDGNFAPDKPITRAEFATVINRFYGNDSVLNSIGFFDIGGHWAEESIISAASLALIDGYEDGSFKPDAYISRAEAMTIINRILVRYIDQDGLCEGVKMWPDNPNTAWYYYQVIEATSAHTFNRRIDGVYEDWIALIK